MSDFSILFIPQIYVTANFRNKELMLQAGVLPLLEKMISNPDTHAAATALYLNLSCFDNAKSIIGASLAVPFLVRLCKGETDSQCKLDALHALYNLSTLHVNIPELISAGIINALKSLLVTGDRMWTEKCLAVLLNLAPGQAGKEVMSSTPGLITALATMMDTGEPTEQEQAVSCLFILCNGSEKCCQLVLQEGVIPALVSISVNGTTRGREKAQKLLMLFREQRQRDHPPVDIKQQEPDIPQKVAVTPIFHPEPETAPEKHLTKSMSSRKKMGRAFSFLFKSSKSYSVRHY